MSDPLADDDKPLDPTAAGIVARVRWLMLISGATTFIGVAAILGVIGYRVFKSEGSAGAADINGAIEVRTFDLRTLRPVGRLRFATEP